MRELVKRNLSVESREVNLSDVLKQLRYFWVSMAALLLSAFFPVVEKQLVILSIITGVRWIVGGSSREIKILINLEKR